MKRNEQQYGYGPRRNERRLGESLVNAAEQVVGQVREHWRGITIATAAIAGAVAVITLTRNGDLIIAATPQPTTSSTEVVVPTPTSWNLELTPLPSPLPPLTTKTPGEYSTYIPINEQEVEGTQQVYQDLVESVEDSGIQIGEGEMGIVKLSPELWEELANVPESNRFEFEDYQPGQIEITTAAGFGLQVWGPFGAPEEPISFSVYANRGVMQANPKEGEWVDTGQGAVISLALLRGEDEQLELDIDAGGASFPNESMKTIKFGSDGLFPGTALILSGQDEVGPFLFIAGFPPGADPDPRNPDGFQVIVLPGES